MKTKLNQCCQLQKKLHKSEKINRSVHEDIQYKSSVMKTGQFISEKWKENRLNRPKRFFKETQKSCRNKNE